VFDDAVQTHKWDYLIGSIHHIDQMDDGSPWNIDGDLETFRKGLHQIFNDDIVACTKKFFHYTNDMIDLGGFNMIGHFDKIHLNGRFFEGFDYNNTWYKNLIKETLELIKEKGIIVEINTKSFINKSITFPHIGIWPDLLKMGIQVTVNSDCHYPDLITSGFDYVYKALKDIGFKSTVKIKNGKWTEDPIIC